MIQESTAFGLKAALVQYKNRLSGFVMGREKWDSVKKTLLTAIKMCKDTNDIKYLRSDYHIGIRTLEKRVQNINDPHEQQKLREHIEWLKGDYKKLLDDKAKELIEKKRLSESTMQMPHNSAHLETIENAIAGIQTSHGNKDQLCRKIQLALNKEFKCNCISVNIIENNIKNYFFGATIIPTEEECYKIADNIIRGDENIRFEKCSSFIINLDSKLLYDVAATPREITAAILHEIGHKAFSSIQKVKLKERFIYESRLNNIMPEEMKAKFVNSKCVLMTPIINCFVSSFSSIGLLKEINSDSFAVRYGYGRDLSDLIQKLIELDSRMDLFRKDRKDVDENDLLIKWSIKNMIDFQKRKKSRLRDLERQTKGEILKGVPELINAQIKKVKSTKSNSFGLAVSKNIMNESFKSFVEVKTKGMSQLELDELRIEIDRIEYHEDKLYLINRIHKDIDDCNKQIEKLNKSLKKNGCSGSSIKIQEINNYKKELMKLAKEVTSARIIEKDFELKVAYPKGYQG